MGDAAFENSPTFSCASRKRNVRNELTLALQTEGTYPEVNYSENNEGDSILDGPVVSADVDEESPEEQGQEVLWVENAADPSTPKSKPGTTRKKLPSSQKIAQIIADGSKSHVIVLPEPMVETVPREALDLKAVKMKDKVVNSESRLIITAEKVAAAKQLLEQAINEKSAKRSNDLSNKAFSLAMEARGLVELPTNTTEELTTVLNDASTKGKAEVVKIQELKYQHKDGKSRSEGENHASRARSLMDFILPENKVATPKLSLERYELLSHTELEKANSADAICKADSRPKDFDVLSMSSLNEILDGPDEEATASTLTQSIKGTPKGRESKRTISTDECQYNDTTDTNQKIMEESGESILCEKEITERKDRMDDDERRYSTRKSGLFGGLFVSKKIMREKRKQTREFMPDTIAASILTANETSRSEEPDHDAIDPNEELHAKVAAIDQKVWENLHEAIINDETESITSFQNVKVHFIQDSSENRAQVNQEQILDAMEALKTGRLAQHRRAAESVRPLLVAAPKARSSLHPTNSGDSSPPADYSLSIAGHKPILKNQKGKEKYEQKKKKLRSPRKGESDDGVILDKMCDRYAVIPDDYRYDTIEPTDSFRAFLHGRDSEDLLILPASDTVSTFGTRPTSDQSPASQRVPSQTDKYQPDINVALASHNLDKYQTSVLETQGALRIRGTTEMSSEVFHRTSTKACRSPAREIYKPKRDKAAKKLKRKSLAGIFGFGSANAVPNSKQAQSKHTVSSVLPKSESSMKLQTKNTEQVTRYPIPSVRIHVLPNIENGRGNPPKTDLDNYVKNAMTQNDHAPSYCPGSISHYPLKTDQTQKISLTYSEPIKDFDHGLDKPTETDSTLSLCEEPGPETEAGFISMHDASDEDSLVAHLKKQMVRQPRRGIDPTSAKVSSRGCRLDP